MEKPTLAAVPRVAVDDFLRGRAAVIPPALVAELADAVEIALLTAVRTERRDCVGECTPRAELWQKTAAKPETTEPMRREAERRANEALYLADVIATRA